jgi:ubiquinone/menaquinone biosynthesis C-methylase UbiE
MSQIKEIDDPQYVAHQYQDGSNLNLRVRLHQRFSVNRGGWHRWVFDQFDLPPDCRLLELGCGMGDLWLENLGQVPTGWKITLSDFSKGMVRNTRSGLNKNLIFRFGVIDAQSIPYSSGSFGAVIANHMLYHLPDRVGGLSEVQRVLNTNGRFYASTIGERHLEEISDLLCRFDPQLASWSVQRSDSFTLENGETQLRRWFTKVQLHRYNDSLVVTEAKPLVDYILSGRLNLSTDRRDDLTRFVESELRSNSGKLHITKDSGVFEST